MSIRNCYECSHNKDCNRSVAKGINNEEELIAAEKKETDDNIKRIADGRDEQTLFIEKVTGEDVIEMREYLYKGYKSAVSFMTKSYRGHATGTDNDDVKFMPRNSACVCPISMEAIDYDDTDNIYWLSDGPDGSWHGSFEDAMFSYINDMTDRGIFKKAKRVRSPDGYGAGDSACAPIYNKDVRTKVPKKPSVPKKSTWKHIKEE